MFKKLFLLGLFVIACLSIKQKSQDHLTNDHELFSAKPFNPKKRSEKEVCEHYGGKMCSIMIVGQKCCAPGRFIQKDKYCGGVGCEHTSINLKKKDWNY